MFWTNKRLSSEESPFLKELLGTRTRRARRAQTYTKYIVTFPCTCVTYLRLVNNRRYNPFFKDCLILDLILEKLYWFRVCCQVFSTFSSLLFPALYQLDGYFDSHSSWICPCCTSVVVCQQKVWITESSNLYQLANM